MTPQIGFLFALLAVMVYLFLTERLPVDLTAFLGLATLIFAGYLTPGEAFAGFSSPAVITMLSVFIVGAALLETGVADIIGGRVHALVGDSETRLIVVLMVTCGLLSAFMNNIAATAVLMPAVSTIARQARLAPGRLFMPLAFGAILGGTTTLVGTPPNILAAETLAERGLEPFSLFDFTPVGLAMLGLGVVFMLTLGRRLLPSQEQHGPAALESRDLSQVYRLAEHLFSIRLPEDTPLDGRTLAQTRMGNTLGVKVLEIYRRSGKKEAATAASVLHAGDVLLVDSVAVQLDELLRMQQLEIEKIRLAALPSPVRGVGGVRARVRAGAPLIGHSLRDLKFRDRMGLVVVGVRRGDEVQRVELADWSLESRDEIFALGSLDRLRNLERHPDFEDVEIGFGPIRDLVSELHLLHIPPDSSLVGCSIGASRLGELVGLTVAGLIRGDETYLAISADEVLQADDRLLIGGEPQRLVTLTELGEVLLESRSKEAGLESEELGMVETALAPRSSAIGRTLSELEFQSRYGLLALALWRGGEPRHVDFSHLPLQLGDALLLHGPRNAIRRLAADPDYVVLSQADQAPRRRSKAKWAFASLLLMIGLVATGYQPIHVAAFSAAALAILFGALTMQEAYRAIEWKAIFLVAAVLPVGMAMERTGAAQFLADGISSLAGPYGSHATLAALVVLASVLSQGLDGAPTVVLLAPVVIESAESLGISPYPLMMGVSLAASAAFMTPFSHKANLLVMGAGGYRSVDYLRVGTPLTLFVFVVIVLLVPVFFPF